MSVLATALRELLALGVTGDALVLAIERIEEAATVERTASVREAVQLASAKADQELADRKAKAAERTRKWREKTQPSVTVTSPDVEQRHPTCEPAQVVNPTSSLRSEDTSEANASSVNASSPASKPADPEKPKTKPPKANRGTRLPEDWEPSAEEFALGTDAGLTDEEIHRAALEFRNYWCSRSRDATKLSWRLTWHNRVNEIADRKRRLGPRLAAVSGQSGGGGRGPVSFADIYARRHGPS